MFNRFNNLKIRNKLIWAFLVVISLSVMIGIIALVSQNDTQITITEFLEVDGRIAQLGWQSQSLILMAQRSEKDYFLRYKQLGFEKARTEYINQLQTHIASIHEYMAEIRELEEEEVHIVATKTIDQAVADYETTFLSVVALLEKRGFKNTGIEGQLRQSVHAIEATLKAHNTYELSQLTLDMLTMRRHEKDYLLRTEEKYVRRLHQTVIQFKKNIATTNFTITEKEQLTTLANQYQAKFEQLVQIDTEITTNIESYRAKIRRLESLLKQINVTAQLHEERTHANIQMTARTTRLIIISAIIVAVIVGLWIAIFLASLISKPLTLIVQGAQLLSSGNTALRGIKQAEIEKITTRQDEMGDIGRAFHDLAHYFKTVIADIVQVSQGLAVGTLSITPQSEYRGDFVQIKQALETTLSNQQQVIEDIVQVSQGLATGNLSITPQSEYPGDFLQIKTALETTLSNQRQVIEDIVQVSQGLAAGNLSATPQSEYWGDFLQIKNALETALFNQRIVIEDIVRVSQGLAAGNLSITPQSEYRGDFLQIKTAQETALSNQRQVIQDIVQVSQGLAAGHLRISSQATYQGDFVQIKDALKMALSNLRQVIEDIVQVSQGLAEGEQNITHKAEYQGDFIQIKNALETATLKLAETSAMNVRQDWLKTGQAQLNELMSGDQDIVSLAKNIIAFLTTYIEAQVGLFYQLQESPSDNQNVRIQLIASYAYTANDNRPQEFLLGEGLVGQVAMERQTLSFSQTPEECPPVIRSGLANALPRYVLLLPCLYEDVLKGIIEIGSAKKFTEIHQEFLEQAMPNIGIAINTAESRNQMQELLEQSQKQTEALQSQSEELQSQQEELQQINDELQNQREELQYKQAELQQRNEELQSQSEELQSQSEELQTQQEELKQTNEALEERTKELERQKSEIQHKNIALEKNQLEMEKAQAAIEVKAQELELASQYKSEFLANMSHELRTPLNSLLILAQLLANNKPGNLTDKQIEYAQTIHSAGSDLLTLINEILDLSKVEAGKMEIHVENISLSNLLETIEQKFRHIAAEKGLAFHTTMTDEVPALIQTDVQRLNQIINNLLSNAFKFTTEGEIRLTMQRPTENIPLMQSATLPGVRKDFLESAKAIAINISDTGIGIPHEKQKVIFEAFQQVDGSTSRRYGGTGLGLSISRQLARLLGGELQLHSKEGKGSTFTLYLPEHITADTSEEIQPLGNTVPAETSSHQAMEVKPLEASEPGTPAFSGTSSTLRIENLNNNLPIADDRNNLQIEDKSILIIEDDRKFSKILLELAKEKGFKCIVAEDGKTGLQLVEQYSPNAIILDVSLPQLDGWTVMEILKDNPDTRHIPVHFISASDHSSLEAKKMGAIGYLHKPVNMDQLSTAFIQLEQFLSKNIKNLLIVADNEPHQKQIMGLIDNEDVQITLATTKAVAVQHLETAPFDCIIIDIDIEQHSGIKLLEQIYPEKDLCQNPVIVYAERELTPSEETLLQKCANHFPVKSVSSPERLLDEATLFLHQVESHLPSTQRKMLQMAHDKEAILAHKKVLIVDDDARNTFALATVLEEKNMEVFAGNNGNEALELLKEHPDIAVVLMDIMMPEMDGYEATRKIRAQQHFRKLPVIALTAKAMKGDKAKCIEAGANDYLSKPVDTDKLISLMRVWLYR